MPRNLRQLIRERAGARCEYCRFHEEHLSLWPFHLDHIVARQHQGSAGPANLAWACQRCNLLKGTNLACRVASQIKTARTKRLATLLCPTGCRSQPPGEKSTRWG